MTDSQPSSSAGPSASKGKTVLRTTKETHPNLPPGLILDPDGKVCKVCNTWQDYGKISFKKKGFSAGNGSSSSSTSTNTGKKVNPAAGFAGMAGLSSTTSTKQSDSTPDQSRENCPADTEALGRSTWTFLHTSAAYYPITPTSEHKKQMTNLLNSLGLLYPCLPCAEDFKEKVIENPPDVSGRYGLSRWLCERHNEVNEKLGKKGFRCDWENLDKRWKGGPDDGSCD